MFVETTIVGIATALGEGGIAIIRLSGENAVKIFERVFYASKCKPPYRSHQFMTGYVMEGENKIDQAMGVVMYAPNSYTREDVCEIHTHGGQMAVNYTLQLLIKEGAIIAEPGEFTKRAFMNGRIDLSEAEAVMGIIHAQSNASLKAASHQLQGGQSRFIKDVQEKVIAVLAGMEAHIDYPDEIDEEEALSGLQNGLTDIIEYLSTAVNQRNARIVTEGLRVALCGAPNAGKSTLFNALLGEERAIVTEIAGTTRDVLQGTFTLDGITVHLLDTAGLHDSQDTVEKIGIQRAKDSITNADVVLLLIDSTTELKESEKELLLQEFKAPSAVILTKSSQPVLTSEEEIYYYKKDANIISLSAKEGIGIEKIYNFLRPYITLPQQHYLTQQRHLQIASEVLSHLSNTLNYIENQMPLEMATVDLHEALYLLGQITGESVDEKLLDDIFSRFCVGK